MFRSSIALAFAAIVWTGSAPLKADDVHSKDRKFLEDAYRGGLKEVEMGRLGVTRGTDPLLIRFAQRLIDDHSKSNEQLKALAERKRINLPIDKPIDSKGLGDDTGPGFDARFAKMAVEDHEKDVKDFEEEAKAGEDPEVKQWAADTLPTLREHLQAAKALHE